MRTMRLPSKAAAFPFRMTYCLAAENRYPVWVRRKMRKARQFTCTKSDGLSGIRHTIEDLSLRRPDFWASLEVAQPREGWFRFGAS